jgi:uncharacterized protein
MLFSRRNSLLILLLYALLLAGAVSRVLLVGFNYDFEAFFPKNDPETRFFLEFREKFGPDNDFVLIALENEKGIFQQDFLRKVVAFTDSLENIKNVERVVSPVQMKTVLRDPVLGTPITFPVLSVEVPSKYRSDSSRIWQSPELLGQFFSKNGKSIAILVDHTPYIGDQDCQPLTDDLNELVKRFNFSASHIAGRCIGQSYYVDVIREELVLFLGIAFVLIIIVLSLIFRNFFAVLLPLLVVGTTVGFTIAIMQLTGKELDVMANIIPTILVVVGLSVSIHLQTKYLDYRQIGLAPAEALKKTFQQIGLPAIFTTLTTAVGFLSLATTGIIPIDDFGIYASMGVVLSFIISFTLLPALLIVFPVRSGKSGVSKSWTLTLSALFSGVLKYQRVVLISTAVFIIVGIAGLVQVKENTYLLEDLRKENPLHKSFSYFGDHFRGTRPMEIALEANSGDLFSPEALRAMEKLEQTLFKHYPIDFLVSPLTLVRAANRSLAGGNPTYFVLPEDSSRVLRLVREVKQFVPASELEAFFTPDFKVARMRGLLPDMGSAEAYRCRQAFEEEWSEIGSELPIRMQLTGTAELIDKNNRNLAWNIGQGLAVAFIVITLIITFLFRSWKVVLISMVPNLLPMLFLAAIMGYLGISLKVSTAILFTIAFGIAVDDTIHFLGKLKLETSRNDNLPQALKNTFIATGKPIVITTLLLCTGFMILGLSDFQATRIIGLLISTVLLLALVCDLFLLPILLLWFSNSQSFKRNIKKK